MHSLVRPKTYDDCELKIWIPAELATKLYRTTNNNQRHIKPGLYW